MLLVNFTWWVNRKDPSGKNLFQGGFLGLDNIGVFDRSAQLPGGGTLEQSDGTAWMAFFSQSMLELALALAEHDPAYEGFVVKFVQHWFQIASAMDPLGDNPDEMWDEEDGFFYDVLRMPDGTGRRIKVRTLVGLLPLCATAVLPAEALARFPRVSEQLRDYYARNADLLGGTADPTVPGVDGCHLLALVDEHKLRRILERMLDEGRFLGPHGIRSVSKWHEDHPYTIDVEGQAYTVGYEPAESRNGMFGGNSNWRGPVWFPINLLLIRALLQFHRYYGDGFRIECPTGSGHEMNLYEVAEELGRRLATTFTRDEDGRRPVFGGAELFQEDPSWGDNLLFYEYFHGDNGAGIGASHQTGWTGVVARIIQLFAEHRDAQSFLRGPRDRWPEARPSASSREGDASTAVGHDGCRTWCCRRWRPSMTDTMSVPQGFSTEELSQLLGLLEGADTVELKLTVPDGSHRSAVVALGMDPLDANLRQVFFFDTQDLLLNRHGVIVRARRAQGGMDDSVVKLRPVVPNELPAKLRKLPDFGVEVDAMPGGFVCSARLKASLRTGKVKEAVAGERPIRSLFTKQQRAFLAEHAPEGVGIEDLAVLGPITVLKLKFSPRELRPAARRRAVELPGRLADPGALHQVRTGRGVRRRREDQGLPRANAAWT